MNIVLFSPDEWGHPLPPADYRSLHVSGHLSLRRGDSLRVGLIGQGAGIAMLRSEPASTAPLELLFPQKLTKTFFPPIHLIIGHPRPPVFRRLLKDLASMGIARISWVHTALGEKSYLSSRVWKPESLERQLHLGLEQGAHTSMPAMKKFYSLQSCLADAPSGRPHLRFFLHPPKAELFSLLPGKQLPPLTEALRSSININCEPPPAACPISIAIGPERGWTREELLLFQDKEFLPAHLGRTLLRTETSSLLAGGMAMLFAQAHYRDRDLPGEKEAE